MDRSVNIHTVVVHCKRAGRSILAPPRLLCRSRSRCTSNDVESKCAEKIHFEPSRRVAIFSFASAGIIFLNPTLGTYAVDASNPSLCLSALNLTEGSSVQLSIIDKCGLGVSIYPDFVYSPVLGGGEGLALESKHMTSRISLSFPPQSLNIPPVEFSTTTFLGLPLPPPLKIQILPEVLDGWLDRETGQVELHFAAKFIFTAGALYQGAPLYVNTILTTEESKGVMRSGRGSRLNSNGECRLVGVAQVPPAKDIFLDNFLMLPTDVLAELPIRLTFASSN